MDDLTYRLERASYRGEVAFSSRAAADLVNVQLALEANKRGLEVQANLNALACALEPWTTEFEPDKTTLMAPGTLSWWSLPPTQKDFAVPAHQARACVFTPKARSSVRVCRTAGGAAAHPNACAISGSSYPEKPGCPRWGVQTSSSQLSWWCARAGRRPNF